MKRQKGMKTNKTKYIRVRVTEKTKEIFEAHCKKYNYNPSKRIRAIIEKELRNEI